MATMTRTRKTTMNTERKDAATRLGAAAFHAGQPSAPCLSSDLMNMMDAVQDDFAGICKAFIHGWETESAKAMMASIGD